ncbi:hypothetical protein LCGC14_1237230 [marine sediment metagenome]|uniref:Uncharacterized protein n=1 Tax=marine sediment metagenome TaxID=412755 RepID=A0A0F9NP40_9ZZZZ
MVNKNGQLALVIMLFVGLIVTASIISDIANQEELITGSFSVTNGTVAVPSAANGTTDLTGRDLIEEIAIVNATSGGFNALDVTGLTLQRGFGTNGLLSVQLHVNDSGPAILGNEVNVSYTYRADGFVGNGNIAVTQLITLFSALAMVVFAIVMLFQGPLRELINRKF